MHTGVAGAAHCLKADRCGGGGVVVTACNLLETQLAAPAVTSVCGWAILWSCSPIAAVKADAAKGTLAGKVLQP